MHLFSIPAYSFPSTTLFVDDSRDFLLNFVLHLDEHLAYRIVDSPFKALNLIYTSEVKKPFLTDRPVDIDCAAIQTQLYNPQRFSELSVVVVDYAMAHMDGIEFCRRLAKKPIKKIVLIGPADEERALVALNNGLINKYILKRDPEAASQIIHSIHQLQSHYFQNTADKNKLSASMMSCSWLYDQLFIQTFWNLCQKNKIVEFYWVDEGFFMLDDDANISYLLIKHEDDISLHFNKWSNSHVSLQKCSSDSTYYYSYIKKPLLDTLESDKIRSYHQYLVQLDVEEMILD